jgi:Zn-dependent protease with chaperone function
MDYVAKEILKVCGEEGKHIDWRFGLIASPMANAYSTATGMVIISTATFQILDPDEIAALLAHEMAHVLIGHAYEGFETRIASFVLKFVTTIFGYNSSIL